MWNKRHEADARPQPAAAPQPAAPAAAPAPAPSPRPVEAPASTAVLGRSVVVKGEIRSQEDLVIDGEVQGLVEAVGHRLTIGPNGNLQANGVKAREVVVMGKMKGAVEATDKVYIRKDAQLIGDVQTAGIVIEDGAYFKGGIDIRKGQNAKEAAKEAK
jgi:cytoskeletal protein CcmA (bactofilin family)